jgi:hypothetical protein
MIQALKWGKQVDDYRQQLAALLLPHGAIPTELNHAHELIVQDALTQQQLLDFHAYKPVNIALATAAVSTTAATSPMATSPGIDASHVLALESTVPVAPLGRFPVEFQPLIAKLVHLRCEVPTNVLHASHSWCIRDVMCESPMRMHHCC